MICPNYLTLKEFGDFMLNHPIRDGESHQAWLERHNPRQPDETELQWTFRLCEDKDWVDYIQTWPCVACPFTEAQDRTKKAGKPIYNVELNGKQKMYVGDMGFRTQTEKVAAMIDKVMSDRIKRATLLKNLGKNPGGEESQHRYGMMYHDKAVFHLLMQHLQVAAVLNVNIGIKSWPYTNLVMPSPAGQKWGANLPDERDNDPDIWLKTLDEDARMGSHLRHKHGRVFGHVATRINGASRPAWSVLATSAPVVSHQRKDHVLIRCHRLEHVPKSDMVVDDPDLYRPRMCTYTGQTWKMWQYYCAVIPMRTSGASGFVIPGWMNPEKLRTYEIKKWAHPAAPKDQQTEHYFVPVDDFEPIEDWLACIKGWDKAKLVENGRIFVT